MLSRTLQLSRGLSRATSFSSPPSCSLLLAPQSRSRLYVPRRLSSIPRMTTRPADISTWSKEEVTSWLEEVEPLDAENKKIWESLEISGRSLEGVSQQLLMQFGMTDHACEGVPFAINRLLGKPLSTEYLRSKTLSWVCTTKFKSYLKKNPADPVKLATNEINLEETSRNTAIRTVFADLAWRVALREMSMAYDTQRNPMTCTHTTKEGVESHFLDELAALRPNDLDMSFGDLEEMRKLIERRGHIEVKPRLPETMHKLRNILENSVAVTITYSGEYELTEWDESPTMGLGLRALHSYFVGPETSECGMKFSRFATELKQELGDMFRAHIYLQEAIRCITRHSRKGVLLLVEIPKNASDSVVRQIVQVLGGCLNENDSNTFNTVISLPNVDTVKNGQRSYLRVKLPRTMHGEQVADFEIYDRL